MTDDFPLPDGPTIASSGAPTRRATSSATSRSRPKKYSASSASNAARPLYGQTIGARSSSTSRATRPARSRADCSSTTLPASSASSARASLRPAAARSATASTRRVASRRAHSLAASWTRRATPWLLAINASTGIARPLVGRRIDRGDRPDAVGVEWLEHDRVARFQPRQRRRLRPGGQHQGRDLVERGHEPAQRGSHLGRRAIGVVDHDQRGPPGLAGAREDGQRGLGRAGPGGVEHGGAFAVRVARELGREPGLAHAIRADERDQRARPSRRALPAGPQPAQLVLAADQWR